MNRFLRRCHNKQFVKIDIKTTAAVAEARTVKPVQQCQHGRINAISYRSASSIGDFFPVLFIFI